MSVETKVELGCQETLTCPWAEMTTQLVEEAAVARTAGDSQGLEEQFLGIKGLQGRLATCHLQPFCSVERFATEERIGFGDKVLAAIKSTKRRINLSVVEEAASQHPVDDEPRRNDPTRTRDAIYFDVAKDALRAVVGQDAWIVKQPENDNRLLCAALDAVKGSQGVAITAAASRMAYRAYVADSQESTVENLEAMLELAKLGQD